MNKYYDTIIIGGGPAGMMAASYGKFYQLNVAIISNEFGGEPLSVYPQKPIYNIIGNYGINGKQLADSMIDQLKKLNVPTYESNVNQISKTSDGLIQVKCSQQIFTCKYLILAVGEHSTINNLINGINLEENRIKVNINQLTNIENVFAIGNCCIYQNKPSSIATACGEATVAVRSIINKLK